MDLPVEVGWQRFRGIEIAIDYMQDNTSTSVVNVTKTVASLTSGRTTILPEISICSRDDHDPCGDDNWTRMVPAYSYYSWPGYYQCLNSSMDGSIDRITRGVIGTFDLGDRESADHYVLGYPPTWDLEIHMTHGCTLMRGTTHQLLLPSWTASLLCHPAGQPPCMR